MAWQRRYAGLALGAALLLSGCGMALRQGYRQIAAFESARTEAARAGLASFNQRLDRGQFEQAAQLFTADGRLQVGDQPVTVGPAAIGRQLAAVPPAIGAGGLRVTATEQRAGEVLQRGRYTRAAPAAGEAHFEAVWVLGPEGHWQMRALVLATEAPA